MTVLTSTYRLQFRGDVTFDRAVKLVPYLEDLGISHVYASPIFTATTGSTHGYDVTDPNEIDPALGGRQGFDMFCAALQRAGMGLVLDIVPNHMAASVENVRWNDVLRHGSASRYASCFDIDWSRKLTLPQLGKPLNEVLAAQELHLRHEPVDGRMYLEYFDSLLPLSDESAGQIEARIGTDTGRLQALSMDPFAMTELLAQQNWQLLYWKDAAANLSYRRFFEVTGLVGVRVEDEQVFDDTHRLIFELVRAGQIQGLRIDHIDGLADPGTYLKRLRSAVGPDIFIVVEKILHDGETLPANWPVSGTTGYEFISAMADLFVSQEGLCQLDAAYRAVDMEHADFARGLRKAKLLMIDRNFAGETARLATLARSIFPEYSESDRQSALRELLVAFPVYRTYGCKGAACGEDEAVIRSATEQARVRLPAIGAVEAIAGLLKDPNTAEALEFRARFQQLSGPVMAKAVEDTLFYRYNRLIAMNEVGARTEIRPEATATFHRFMEDRARRQPHGLSATSTHDTKRGEDARARLYSLSQDPEAWVAGVQRWRSMNSPSLENLADGPAPEPNIEWMLYPALAGIWPDDFGQSDRDELKDRFVAYALKAVREAKLRTDWRDESTAYERAVEAYARALLSSENEAFATDFARTLQPFMEIGYRNSLSQLLIKLTAPGIPDIYQGSEGLDLSLVDPDNRRPVDHVWSDVSTDANSLASKTASLKRQIIRSVLRYRRDHPLMFVDGHYLPLKTSGERAANLLAFARVYEQEIAITVVPRLIDGHSSDFWSDTAVIVPQDLRAQMRNLLTDRPLTGGDLLAAQLFEDHPVAILVRHS
ncbi:malto-oligosyltrehalose synthase [Agrobacterium rhizogenes]|nr:malto-oligosyltrehalose synthase [Rhizobium rhizogenes]NTJ79119.1 malto-oligosyltrehalose synthase [Rhizobium rhizogenes]